MKPKSKMLVAVVLGLAFASIGCAEKGACTTFMSLGPDFPPVRGCTDDRTSATCFTGDVHPGVTCEDLGFRRTNENPTMGGITGVS